MLFINLFVFDSPTHYLRVDDLAICFIATSFKLLLFNHPNPNDIYSSSHVVILIQDLSEPLPSHPNVVWLHPIHYKPFISIELVDDASVVNLSLDYAQVSEIDWLQSVIIMVDFHYLHLIIDWKLTKILNNRYH